MTALTLIAEVGDFRRFSDPRELASWLWITPANTPAERQHRRHITKSGNSHAPGC